MDILYRWLLLSVAMYLTTFVVPGFTIRGFWNSVVVAAVFGVLNVFVRWFIVVVLTVGTLGLPWLLGLQFLIYWIANTILLEITASLSSRIHIRNFTGALAASAVISLIGVVIEHLSRR